MKTRQPTGKVPAPLILIQGPAKAGKTTAALQASRSIEKRTIVFDMGDGATDAYADLGTYEIVITDGTWAGFINDLIEATKDETIGCIIIDSVSQIWAGLSVWAEQLARRSPAMRKALQADPDTDVTVQMTHWNAAKDRWGHMLHVLRGWSGVAILIGLTEIVAVVDGTGKPTKQKTTSLQAEKRLASNVTAIVNINERHTATFDGGITPPGLIPTGSVLDADHPGGPIGWLIETLGDTQVSEIPRLSGLEPDLITDEQWERLTTLSDAGKAAAKECAAVNGWTLRRGDLTTDRFNLIMECVMSPHE